MRRIVPLYWTGRLIFILSLFISTAAYSQRTVTGVVIDDVTGDPMIGATILIKGTTLGTTTDLDGKYSIEVAGSDAILVFSFVGSETQEIVVGDQQVINVRLLLSTKLLDELVVIGYGTVKKSDLTGSVAVVTSENLNRTPTSTFDKALQGKAAGVMVSQTSGKPGEGVAIRIRGLGSINKSSDPIYVVDGVITGSINSINPQDIESMQILKDASAAAIYGADGANGVIILTTKRGRSGKTNVSYSSYASINRVPKKLDVMNADEYAAFYNKILEENNQTQFAYSDAFREYYYGPGWEKGTDWQDAIVQTGIAQNHYINVSGGNENSNFSISGGYFNEKGILRKTGADRYNVRANSDFKIGKYVKVGETVNISRMSYQDIGSQQGNAWQVATIASPLMKIFNPNNIGGYEGPQVSFVFPGDTVGTNNTGGNDKPNPRGELDLPDYQRFSNNVMASAYIEVKPADWITFKVTPSVELYTGRTSNWLPKYDLGVRSVNRASLHESYYDGQTYSLENQLTFSKSFGDHTITGTGVYHVRGSNSTSLSVDGLGYNYPQLRVMSQASEWQNELGSIGEYRSLSSLGRVIYDYKGKYLFTGSIRRDGVAPVFGEKNLFGVFPSLSFAWKLNEDLLQNVEQINLLKVRFGWGKTGNSRIDYFGYDDFIDGTQNFSPVFGEVQKLVPGVNIFYSFANPFIKWESAAMTNIGFDMNAFNNKLQVSAEYYIKNQDDLLVRNGVPSIFGRSGDGSEPWVNLARVQNRGFEIATSYKKMEGTFNYSVNLSLTTIKNEVKYVPKDIPAGNNITMEMHSIGSLYGFIAERILTPADFDTSGNYLWAAPTKAPSPGDIKFKDLNNDGFINDRDKTIIGKPLPDMLLGLGFEGYFKGFDFSIFLNGMFNYQVFNAQRAGLCSFNVQDLDHNKLKEYVNNYYTSENPSTEFVRVDPNNENINDRISTWWIEDASFLRVKDLQLGYSLPSQISSALGITKGRIYVSAANSLVFTKYKGRDPEGAVSSSPINSGTDNGTYPTPRSVTFGIQVEF
ncbi:MAG: TonB-dependent receptor [Bacteroidales bacterium]